MYPTGTPEHISEWGAGDELQVHAKHGKMGTGAERLKNFAIHALLIQWETPCLNIKYASCLGRKRQINSQPGDQEHRTLR